MKHYTPLAAQQDLELILAAVHRLQETVVITPTDGDDAKAAVILPKSEWEALSQLAFLEQPLPPHLAPTPRRFERSTMDRMEWG